MTETRAPYSLPSAEQPRLLDAAQLPAVLVWPPEAWQSVSEHELEEALHKLAAALGYRYYHTHDSRRSEPGYPDDHVIGYARSWFVECKTERGRLTAAQLGWRDDLTAVHHEWRCLRPSGWGHFAAELIAAREDYFARNTSQGK